MADAYVIETAGLTAGIVVLEKRGMRFYASEPLYYPLDGKIFAGVGAVHRAVGTLRRGRAAGIPGASLQPAA